MPKDYTIKNGIDGLNERPVGTGPWKLVEWKRKDSMRFERWEGHRERRPRRGAFAFR